MKIDVRKAEADLEALIARAEAGEEVVVTRDGRDVVRLTPVAEQARTAREAGFMKGKIVWSESFWDPLPEEELRGWSGDD